MQVILWTFVICIGATGWGCGDGQHVYNLSYEDCMKTVSAVSVQTNGTLTAGDASKMTVAYCAPQTKEIK